MAGLVNLTTLSANFKNKYGQLSDDTFNTSNVLTARAKVVSDFVGSTYIDTIPLGFAGSVGVSTLPEPNAQPLSNASFSAKKIYGRMKIDREALYASKGDEGAFVELLSNQTAVTVKSYARLGEFFWMGNGDGILGQIAASSGVQTNSDPTFVLNIGTTATPFLEAAFEERDYVHIGVGNTDLFEITIVDPVNSRITVARLSGSKVPANSDNIYIQGGSSGTVSPQGLKSTVQATSGSLYGITVGRRWQSYQQLNVGTGLTVDLMNQNVLELRRRCGQNPKFILTSFKQFRRYMALMEDQKRYDMTTINSRKEASLGGYAAFTGLTYLTTTGPIPVLESRFCPDDTMYFLNDDYIKQVRRKGFGWFEDDGTVILRMADSDAYEARYGGYYENYIMPTFQSVITGLS